MKRGATALSMGCALLLALAGCGTKAGGGGGGAEAAGPPAGGWPQPVNGRLTTKMCGLLTDADYAKYGHERLPVVSQKQVDDQPNAVDCLYTTQDDLNLSLQPTAEAAKLAYADTLDDHKERLTEDHRQTVLANNVVPGADESWFDYWTLGTANSKYTEYEIGVRRGSLIVSMILSGLKGKTEKDPRVVLSGLAGLVLQRIPSVGRTDTGKTQKARFSVTGPGRAKQIVYNDPATSKTVTLKNVKLPWHVEKPLVTLGSPMVMFTLNATSNSPMAALGCSISVDGQTVVVQQPGIGAFASCVDSYTPPK
jgi:Mycobacterium membrane protein